MGEIIRFLLAVKKHNFLRTSPCEAHNTMIRMPAEMRRNGAAEDAGEVGRMSTDAPGWAPLPPPRRGRMDQSQPSATGLIQ